MSEIVVGIDLGTTNSCVTVHLNDKLKNLQNKEGGRLTPSFVYLMDQTIIVGEFAKRMTDNKPENGVYEIKRLIGRKFDDPYVTKNLTYLPFQVKNISNNPVIIVPGKNQIIKKTPQDICTLILTKLKADAEIKLGHPVNKAVITVPAYFNISQREETLAAAHKAGFEVLKLLNEPTAAALSHYYESKSLSDEETISLVYDLGGGTFDVAILSCQGSKINIIGVDGDTHLGGHDFNNLLIEHVCQILTRKYNFDPKEDRRTMRRLSNDCEDAKKMLSVVEEATITLNAFVPGQLAVEIPITREEFEKMANDHFQQTINIVDRCLKKNRLSAKDIKEVIIAGGSTRIPKVEALLQDYFGRTDLCKFGNPDECVAEGAAIQAAMLSQDPSQTIKHIKITDVTALSLGISNFVDLMTVLIKRNTPVPASSTTKRITVYNNQRNMTFDIYEGERLDAKKNYFLGVLEITDLTPAPPGLCAVSVTMSIDQNGILKVSATETVSHKTRDVKIAYTSGNKSDVDVNNAIVDARENQLEDERFRRFAEVKGYVTKYCVRVRFNLEQKGLTNTYKGIYDRCDEAMNILKAWGVNDEKEVLKVKTEIVALCDPIVKGHDFGNML